MGRYRHRRTVRTTDCHWHSCGCTRRHGASTCRGRGATRDASQRRGGYPHPTPMEEPTPTPPPFPTPTPEPGFGDGSYIVRADIEAGTYRSTRAGTCYWARLSGFGGELDDITANGNNSPEIVTVASGDAGFETQGCGRWLPLDEMAPTR